MALINYVLHSVPVLILFGILWIVNNYINILYEYKRKVKLEKYVKINKSVQSTTIQIYDQAPGPMPLPFIGNLAEIGKYEVPFEGFTALAKKYGDAYSLFLGTTRCLVVNNLELIREVLNQNGRFFGGRPDFIRFHKLFGGDRNNCKY